MLHFVFCSYCLQKSQIKCVFSWQSTGSSSKCVWYVKISMKIALIMKKCKQQQRKHQTCKKPLNKIYVNLFVSEMSNVKFCWRCERSMRLIDQSSYNSMCRETVFYIAFIVVRKLFVCVACLMRVRICVYVNRVDYFALPVQVCKWVERVLSISLGRCCCCHFNETIQQQQINRKNDFIILAIDWK